jgi:hypothetical protein
MSLTGQPRVIEILARLRVICRAWPEPDSPPTATSILG